MKEPSVFEPHDENNPIKPIANGYEKAPGL
jgi:hypothetical protein